MNDIYYTTTSEYGIDITLKDRKKEYGNREDYIIYQEDCIFSEYDYNTQQTKCPCKAKEPSLSLTDINIDKTKLLKNIKDIKNVANFSFFGLL